MRTYNLCHRIATRKNKKGEIKTWKSKNFYISYYENRERKWIDTGCEDEEAARLFYDKKVAELECGTVYEFLKQHNWLDATKNPLYVDSNEGNINYHLHYAHSLKNVRYLQIILEDIKDPIKDCLFEDVSRKDVQEFKDRLANLKTYIDGHGHERETTTTFKNKTIAAFSTIWSYYLRTGKANIRSNPFLSVEKFKKKTPITKKYIFTPEDYSDLFDREVLETLEPISFYDSKRNGSLTPLSKEKWTELVNSIWIDFFEFVFLSGLRGGEAAAICVDSFEPGYHYYVLDVDRAFKSGLRKADVNSNSRTVEIIGKPKTGETRRIVLCDRAREIAVKYLAGKTGKDLLFTLPMKKGQNKYSTYLLSQQRANAFRLFIGEMNAQYHFTDKDNEALSLHGARTSLNSVLLDKTNLREGLIAYVMGWTSHSLTTTQREHYTRYEINDLIDVAREINRLYLKKDFKGFPSVEEQKAISRQSRRAEIMKRSEKLRWIKELRDTIECYIQELHRKVEIDEGYYNRAYKRGKNLADEISSKSNEELMSMEGIQLMDYATRFIGITRGSRFRNDFQYLSSSYNNQWDE